MSRVNAFGLLPLLVGGLVACGGDDNSSGGGGTTASTETTEPVATSDDPPTSAGVDDFCGPMEALANYNADTPLPDIGADWGEYQQQILDRADEGLTLYDDAIDVAPEEPRADLQTLRNYSVEILAAVEEAESLEDLGAAVGTPPDDVRTATSELQAYIQETCGFGLTEAG